MDQKLLTWRQKKQAYGRSDRLRRLADEFARRDKLSGASSSSGHLVNLGLPGTEYGGGLNEKDNTSASENSNLATMTKQQNLED